MRASPAVKQQVAKLPWSDEALPKIKQMAVSKEIKIGFAKVKEFEQESDAKEKRKLQLEHLLAIADHEQGVILQPLIYEDNDFVYWLKTQRKLLVRLASPDLDLLFSSACDTSVSTLKSVAPKGTQLEDFDSRMKWIGDAAQQFHKLMERKRDYMEGELRKMASWVSLADKK